MHNLQPVEPSTIPQLSGRFEPVHTEIDDDRPRRRRARPGRPPRGVPPQRPQPGVHAARQLHLPAGGRRDAARRVARGRQGPLRQPVRAHPGHARRGAGRAGAVRRAHDARLRRPVAARCRPRSGLAVQARRLRQHRPPRRPLPRPRGGHAAVRGQPRRSTPSAATTSPAACRRACAPIPRSTRSPARWWCSATTSPPRS